MVMLNTATNWATIFSAVPVAIAALVFLFRTVPKAVNQPKGLRLGLEPAIGDPGCCVHITNYGPVEHYISRVGTMPAHLRPRWSVCTRRATINQTIEPGRHLPLLVPQPLPLDRELPDYELESRRGITRRYYEWLKQDQPGGPLPLVPYVLLGDGSVVLGKKTRVQPPPQCLAQVPLCTCGHAITQHALRQRTRLAPSMTAYGRCGECGCRRSAARE